MRFDIAIVSTSFVLLSLPASAAAQTSARTSAQASTLAATHTSAQTAAQATTPPPVTETVVVTASVAPLPETSVARSVTTLTRADFDLFGLSSVIDALRIAAGVDVDARGSHGVQSDLSIRGATFGQSLVLLDGQRLNDSQSGHHDGDIPVPIVAVDRIEIVSGDASSVHGADALGGVIDVITRRGQYSSARAATGQYGYVDAEGAASGVGPLPAGWIAAGWAQRSSGFTFDREFATGGGSLTVPLSPSTSLDVRHQRKAFGADGFYGPSPSKEWTDQTVVSLDRRDVHGVWTIESHTAWKDHGDHFRWDINQPGFAENEHRDDAEDAGVTARRAAHGAEIAIGASGGGEWVRSTNLGNHDYARGGLFAEMQAPLGASTSLDAGARWDGYSTFGQALDPTVAVVHRISPAVRVRAAAARAFRVPTFTELYYHDPVDLGSPNLRPEHGWSLDGGLDADAGGWTASISPFVRWDRDVIDWVRATPDDIWQSTNVRDVTTRGVDATLVRHWRDVLARVHYSVQSVDAPALTLLSKYVLSYARQAVGGALSLPIGRAATASIVVDYRDRYDGQRYTLVDLRLAQRAGRHADLFVEGSNLLDARYQEITGVEMPGRWVTLGVTLR